MRLKGMERESSCVDIDIDGLVTLKKVLEYEKEWEKEVAYGTNQGRCYRILRTNLC